MLRRRVRIVDEHRNRPKVVAQWLLGGHMEAVDVRRHILEWNAGQVHGRRSADDIAGAVLGWAARLKLISFILGVRVAEGPADFDPWYRAQGCFRFDALNSRIGRKDASTGRAGGGIEVAGGPLDALIVQIIICRVQPKWHVGQSHVRLEPGFI